MKINNDENPHQYNPIWRPLSFDQRISALDIFLKIIYLWLIDVEKTNQFKC
jgi:hypothetical protein